MEINFDFTFKTILMLIMSLFAIFGLGVTPGCSASNPFSTGPEQADMSIGTAGGIAQALVSKLDAENITAEASGTVTNPKYAYEWFGGTGFYTNGSIQLIGGDLRFGASGAGGGLDQVDNDVLDAMQLLVDRPGIPDEKRAAMINELLTRWIESNEVAEDEPEPEQ